MSSEPLVSIITNTKNRANLIPRCIESIRVQTYRNYEHIIADGGDDNTEEVVKSYNDPHIRYIRVPEGGPVEQTRQAFAISKGEFITFLDDDDEYLPEKIEKQVSLISPLPADYGFIYGSMTYYDFRTDCELDVHKAELGGGIELLPAALANPVICGTPTLMFRRKVFAEIGGTWIKGIGNDMSDWALVCKALRLGWKVAPLKDSYLKIYVNHTGIRMSDNSRSIANAEKYILFHSYFLREYEEIFQQNPKAAILHLDNLFCYSMTARHIRKALGYWLKLVRVRPNFRTFALLPHYLIKLCK